MKASLSASAQAFVPRDAAITATRPTMKSNSPPSDENSLHFSSYPAYQVALERKEKKGHYTPRRRRSKNPKPILALDMTTHTRPRESLGIIGDIVESGHNTAEAWFFLYSTWVQAKRSVSLSFDVGNDEFNSSNDGFGNGDVDEIGRDSVERRRWSEWAMHAAEKERQRRMLEAEELDREEKADRHARGQWAIAAIEQERQERITLNYLVSLSSTNWFNELISTFSDDYELVCPHYRIGCRANVRRSNLFAHLETCEYGGESGSLHVNSLLNSSYEEAVTFEVICPNAILGCCFQSNRAAIMDHLVSCDFRGKTPAAEEEERRMIIVGAIAACEEERTRRVEQSPGGATPEGEAEGRERGLVSLLRRQHRELLIALSGQIRQFWSSFRERQAKEEPVLREAIAYLRQRISTLWPFARLEVVGSFATGLWGPSVEQAEQANGASSSDLDLVVCFSDASLGLLGLRGSLLNVLAGHLVGCTDVTNSSEGRHFIIRELLLSARIPVIKGELSFVTSCFGANADAQRVSVSIDISLDGAAHSGVAATAMCQTLLAHLEHLGPLSCLLKETLRSKGLGNSYTGGLGGYGSLLLTLLPLLRRRWGRDNGDAFTPASPLRSYGHAHSSFGGSSSGKVPSSSPSLSPSPSLFPSPSPSPRKPSRSASFTSVDVRDPPTEAVPLIGTCAPRRSPSLSFAASFGLLPGGEPGRGPGPATFLSTDKQKLYGRTVALLLLGLVESTELQKVTDWSTEEALQGWQGELNDLRSAGGSGRAEAVAATPSFFNDENESESGENEPGPLLQCLLSFYTEQVGELHSVGLSVRNGGFRFDLTQEPLHPLARNADDSLVELLIEDPIDILRNVAHNTYRATAIHKTLVTAHDKMRQAAVKAGGNSVLLREIFDL